LGRRGTRCRVYYRSCCGRRVERQRSERIDVANVHICDPGQVMELFEVLRLQGEHSAVWNLRCLLSRTHGTRTCNSMYHFEQVLATAVQPHPISLSVQVQSVQRHFVDHMGVQRVHRARFCLLRFVRAGDATENLEIHSQRTSFGTNTHTSMEAV
jgi:hypothetical protein